MHPNPLLRYRDFANVKDYMVAISRGDIEGAGLVGSYGKAVAPGAVTTPALLWPNGPWAVPSPSGIAAEVLSDSANDTSDGTGIRTLEVHYLDANLDEQIGYATLNGVAAVPIKDELGANITDLRFAQCMHMVTYGSGKAAAGNITLREVGQTQSYSYIAAGATRCSSSARMVPNKRVYFVAGASAGSVSATADAAAIIDIGGTTFGVAPNVHDYTQDAIIIPRGSIAAQALSVAYNFPLPIMFEAGAVVGLVYTIDKGGTIVGDWFGWYETIV